MSVATGMSNEHLAIALMIGATAVFAVQDGISRHLASEYNVLMVVMIRYWFFGAFVVAVSSARAGGVRAAAATRRPGLQIVRGLLLAAEICVMVAAFTLLGLVESHAVFAVYPLIVATLSGPLLGERVGWRRWSAVVVGFAGVLVILAPGSGVFSPLALIPLCAAAMFAMYNLLTRLVAATDRPETSFFWTGTVGAVAMSLAGIWSWEPMDAVDWGWMAALCVTGATGHWLLIRTYATAEASVVQPFAYLQLVFAGLIGLLLFGETLRAGLIAGGALVILAGLFTLWRARPDRRRTTR